MSAPLSGARQARPNFFRRLVAWAQARELAGFVVPDPEAARAVGVDLETTGLRISCTPRHASVLVLVGELPPGLKKAAAVAYAQMPRPRAILAIGTRDVSPLPGPDVPARPEQEDVAAAVAILNSVLSLAVYLRIVVPMYQMPKETTPSSRRSVAAVWVVALVATVAVGLAAQALLGEVS